MAEAQLQGKFEGETFKNETIRLDGSSFKACSFSSCAFIYGGGAPPVISGCNFDKCTWQFADEAANTMLFLSGFYNGGFADLIEHTFHEIRKGEMLKPQAAAGAGPAPSRSFFGLDPLKVFKVPKKK